jgi:DNA-binding CsgD family transcriptional regulator
MRPPLPSDSRPLGPTNAAVRSVVDQLIRALASMAGPKDEASLMCRDGDAEETLVDIELDGFRYLLIRLPKPTFASTRVSLSPREREIVRMVAQGHPNKVIAGVLNISGWTVCTHLRRIFAKLNVGSRAAMVARLLEMGSVDERIRISAGGSAANASPEKEESAQSTNNLRARAARH